MFRHVLIFILGISTLAAFLVDSQADNVRQLGKPDLKKPEHEKLSVTVWPKSTRVHLEEPFEVSLRVVNATEKTQSFQIMCCSWFNHWKSDNPRLSLVIWGCLKNHPITIKLKPGEAEEAKLRLVVEKGPPLVITSFQMGFTPIGEKTTYWSNKVVLGIKPNKRK